MARWPWLTRRRQVDDDLQEEIRSHLAIAAQERIAEGADRQSARHEALRAFGNVTLTTEAARGVWRPRWMDGARDLLNDVRHATHVLAKSSGFSLIVIGRGAARGRRLRRPQRDLGDDGSQTERVRRGPRP
jgi:hypothetical protein